MGQCQSFQAPGAVLGAPGIHLMQPWAKPWGTPAGLQLLCPKASWISRGPEKSSKRWDSLRLGPRIQNISSTFSTFQINFNTFQALYILSYLVRGKPDQIEMRLSNIVKLSASISCLSLPRWSQVSLHRSSIHDMFKRKAGPWRQNCLRNVELSILNHHESSNHPNPRLRQLVYWLTNVFNVASIIRIIRHHQPSLSDQWRSPSRGGPGPTRDDSRGHRLCDVFPCEVQGMTSQWQLNTKRWASSIRFGVSRWFIRF